MSENRYINFGSKASYKIKVQGKINPTMSGVLGGMNIKTKQTMENIFISTLRGQVSDQAALSGILNTMYEMHLPLISVKNIEP